MAHTLIPTAVRPPNSEYAVAAQDACFAILDWFKAACDRASSSSHPLAQGLKALAGENTLRAFSLNYDDIAQQSGIDFYTGFEGRHFQPAFPRPIAGHTLCQLHGSVLWGGDGFELIACEKIATMQPWPDNPVPAGRNFRTVTSAAARP